MARTWTLQDTLTGGSGDGYGARAVADNSSTLYFILFDSSAGYYKVYKWTSAGGFVDISGSTFNVTDYQVSDLALFSGSLYAKIKENSTGTTYTPRVFKYTGGTSWTEVWTGSSLNTSSTSSVGDLEADGNRIVIANRANGGWQIHASTDGSTWTAQTANGGGFGDNTTFLIGRSRYTAGDDDRVLVCGGSNDVWAHDSGNDWQKLNSGSVTAGKLIGYTDGKSRFVANTVIPAIPRHSTNWGVTYSTSSDSSILYSHIMSIGTDAIEAIVSAGTGATIYTYDPGTDTWSSDGTPVSGGDIKHAFRLGSTIYVLVADGDDVKVLSGGTITPPGPPPSQWDLTHSAAGIPGGII